MKKIYLLAMICTCFSLSIFANGVEIDGIYYLLDDTDYTASVTYTSSSIHYNSYTGYIVIPSSVDYNNRIYNVTSIGEDAFYGCTGLTSVTIPNSVTRIGDWAFQSCMSLTSVTIPNSVTSIGWSAFSGCSSLTSVIIPNSVTSIGSSAFSGCNGFTSIEVEAGNTIYDSRNQCNAIIETTTNTLIAGCKNTTIPNSVTSIGEDAFYGCTGLTSVTIPNSVTNIGDGAFYDCTGLTSVTIPNSVTSIGRYAFGFGLTAVHISDLTAWCEIVIDTMMSNPLYYAHNLYLNGELVTDLVIPNDVSIIKEYAFEGGGFSSVTIPSSVTSIGDWAFQGCTSLTSVTIGNSVTSIGMAAFSNCSGLTSVTIPNSVTSIGSYAFRDCDGLPVIENLRYADTYLVEAVDESLSTCNIRQGTKWIGESAFSSCRSLTSVTIPTSVTSIGTYAFWNCSNLTSVYCEAVEPPSLGYNPFYDISHTAVLHVPYESIDAYKAISGYADYFAEIKGFSDVEDITKSTATLKWIPDSAVTQYDINVYTADTLFAHYIVDGNGQIISSQRFAPSIYHQKMDTTVSSTEYFVISLDGLSAGTNYSYTIDGINAQSAPIYHEEGSFKTMDEGEEGLFDVILDDPRRQAIKIFRDGQIYILRREKVYTVTGQEVK